MVGRGAYRIINDILRPCIIVDIYRDAPQRGDFRRELREAQVVLALALVGVRHIAGLQRVYGYVNARNAGLERVWICGRGRCGRFEKALFALHGAQSRPPRYGLKGF
jgi:hypothetical protein